MKISMDELQMRKEYYEARIEAVGSTENIKPKSQRKYWEQRLADFQRELKQVNRMIQCKIERGEVE